MSKDWTPSLQLLVQQPDYIRAHLYTITIASGAQDFFTDFDIDVTYNGNLFKSNSLRFEGMRRTLEIGSSVDEQNVTIGCGPFDTLCGSLFLASIRNGILDGATIEQDLIGWPINTGDMWLDVVQPPLGWPQVGKLSIMRVGAVTKIGRQRVELKLNSPLRLWDIPMPHRYYQPTCQWRLYQSFLDPGTNVTAGCQMAKASFSITGTVGGGVSGAVPATIPVSGGITGGFINGAAYAASSTFGQTAGNSFDGRPTFAQGQILFTSGVLINQQFKIDSNDANNLYLAYPLRLMPNAGDAFTVSAGCYKDPSACLGKFGTNVSDATYEVLGETLFPSNAFYTNFSGNMANFAGYDLVPSESYGL